MRQNYEPEPPTYRRAREGDTDLIHTAFAPSVPSVAPEDRSFVSELLRQVDEWHFVLVKISERRMSRRKMRRLAREALERTQP